MYNTNTSFDILRQLSLHQHTYSHTGGVKLDLRFQCQCLQHSGPIYGHCLSIRRFATGRMAAHHVSTRRRAFFFYTTCNPYSNHYDQTAGTRAVDTDTCQVSCILHAFSLNSHFSARLNIISRIIFYLSYALILSGMLSYIMK